MFGLLPPSVMEAVKVAVSPGQVGLGLWLTVTFVFRIGVIVALMLALGLELAQESEDVIITLTRSPLFIEAKDKVSSLIPVCTAPFTVHENNGFVPPFIGLAINSTGSTEQEGEGD
jgi:hypothetical protein